MPNNWGFNESAPGGVGVRTDQVLRSKQQQKQEPVVTERCINPDAERARELLFLKGWLEASLKDVEEALSKIQG